MKTYFFFILSYFVLTTGLYSQSSMTCSGVLVGETTSTITFDMNGNFVVPPGVTSITVEAYGAGGRGGIGSVNKGRRGGGGGAYVKGTISVVQGQTFVITIGAGGILTMPNGGNTTVIDAGNTFSAAGGLVGLVPPTPAGLGGQASTSSVPVGATATTKLSGGNGGLRTNDQKNGGVGGNAAGGGGTGGAGGISESGTGTAGNAPGGGGGGGANERGDGGDGANGRVIISFDVDTEIPFAVTPARVQTESTCKKGGILSGGSILSSTTACPTGSTMMYSTDGGSTFSNSIPIYDQTTPFDYNKCVCL